MHRGISSFAAFIIKRFLYTGVRVCTGVCLCICACVCGGGAWVYACVTRCLSVALIVGWYRFIFLRHRYTSKETEVSELKVSEHLPINLTLI